MTYLYHLAHATELHEPATTELEHTLTSVQVALPVYLALNFMIFKLLDKYKKSAVLPALLGFNLVIGILSYEQIPVVSIVAITVGITAALLTSLTLIANG